MENCDDREYAALCWGDGEKKSVMTWRRARAVETKRNLGRRNGRMGGCLDVGGESGTKGGIDLWR